MTRLYFLLASYVFCVACSPAPPPRPETKREEKKEERQEKREVRRTVRRTVRRILRRRRPGRGGSRGGSIAPPGPPAPLSPGSNAALLQPLLGVGTGPAGGGAGVITALTNTCAGNQNNVVSSSVSCTWSTQPPAGSSLVCGGATWSGGTGTITGLTITDGTTYTNSNAGGGAIFQFGVGGAANNYLTIQYRFNIGVIAPATVTMNIVGGTDRFANILCNAFTDTGTPAADGTCSFQTNNGTATSNCSAAIVTTGLDYVLGLGANSAGTVQQGAGWTLGSNSGGATNVYQVQLAAGSINPQFINQTAGQLQGVLGFAVKP